MTNPPVNPGENPGGVPPENNPLTPSDPPPVTPPPGNEYPPVTPPPAGNEYPPVTPPPAQPTQPVTPPPAAPTTPMPGMQQPPAPQQPPVQPQQPQQYIIPGDQQYPGNAQPPGQMPPPGQPPYQQYPQQGGQAPNSGKTNGLAIASLISAFFISLLAVILGHISLSQIKKTGDKGKGLAVAGLILGYLGMVAGVIALIVGLAGLGAALTQLDTLDDYLTSDDWDDWDDDDWDWGDDDDDDWDDWNSSDFDWPWTGTMHEVFCDTLVIDEYDLEAGLFFQVLEENAPADLKNLFGALNEAYIDDDVSVEAFEEVLDLAYDAGFDFCENL